jgi:hypothetical protein
MNAPFDFKQVWTDHVNLVLSERAPLALSISDLWSCDRALWDRLQGNEQFPRSMSTFSAFERGHAYENRLWEALDQSDLTVSRYTGIVKLEGIVGHPDFVVYEDDATGTPQPYAIIDATTTASKYPELKFPHALKTMAYAMAEGLEVGCEWIVSIGFGGNILAMQDHWMHLDEEAMGTGKTWREWVTARITHVKALSLASEAPEPVPPIDPTDGAPEAWRCAKYCDNAACPVNGQHRKSA